jgi:hypothetical protein
MGKVSGEGQGWHYINPSRRFEMILRVYKKSTPTWEEVGVLFLFPVASKKFKSWGRFFSSVSQADNF